MLAKNRGADRAGTALAAFLPRVIDLARESGRSILAHYRRGEGQVQYKADHSPVTQADLASHQILEKGLRCLEPRWPVLSEESVEVPFSERTLWRTFWLIDPLDGTKEFLDGTGEFTVNVALIEEDRPVLGVVYAPATDTLYCATRGTGCFRIDREGTKAIRVRERQTGEPRRFVISRCHSSVAEMAAGKTENAEFVAMGSSLKFCSIAEGSADEYPRTGPTMEWDTAAGQCILEEAGGSVVDAKGNPLRYNKPVLTNRGFLATANR
jgi:3'(2'), 5'-bisphosphate nucleotidase